MNRASWGYALLPVILVGVALLAAGAENKSAPKKADALALAKHAGSAAIQSRPLAPVSDDYRLGVNDVIDVHVWKEPELSRVIPVRPDGKISLPLAGELAAEGHTAVELRASITERLKAYVAEPEVTVIVQQINSQRYFVMGEVQSPGAYPLTTPVTLLQALAMAGGFQEFADTDNITVLRRLADGRAESIRFNYKKWLKKTRRLDPFVLQNGDLIIVP